MEFFTQAQQPVKVQTKSQVEAILKYCDDHQGVDYPEHLKNMIDQLDSKTISKILEQFGITKSSNPETLKAKVLPEPKLIFQDGSAVQINNGDWRFHKDKWNTAADLHSFAVVDIFGTDRANLSVERYMESLLKTMKQHGTGIPIDERHTQKVTSCLKVEVQNAQVPSLVGSDAEPIITGIQKAIEKA